MSLNTSIEDEDHIFQYNDKNKDSLLMKMPGDFYDSVMISFLSSYDIEMQNFWNESHDIEIPRSKLKEFSIFLKKMADMIEKITKKE